MDLNRIVIKLNAKELSKGKWMACCPVHDDSTPSLSIGKGDNGKVLLHCFAGCTFEEIVTALGGNISANPLRKKSVPKPETPPPSYTWQLRALEHIKRCEDNLHSLIGKPGYEYLTSRGLLPTTIKRFRLGYNPCDTWDSPDLWGMEGKKILISAGIVIPHIATGQLWGVKVRRLVKPAKWNDTWGTWRYSGPRGGVSCLFGVDHLNFDGRPLLLCSGEFDAMLAYQYLCNFHNLADVVTLAGEGKNLSTRWLFYLLRYDTIFLAYDNDETGQKASAKLAQLSKRIIPIRVPTGKDIGEFHQAGGNLQTWLTFHMSPLADSNRDKTMG